MADRYTGLRDMFDGGGAGQSGARFEGGGILSAAANAVARPAGSRERGEPDMRTGIGGFARDMVDGGGFNRSGPAFQGGPFGGLFGALLNAGGVRPMGYQERLGAVRPQMRPPMPAYMQPPPAPTLAAPVGMPFQAQPVVTPSVYSYPLDPFGDMMVRLHQQGFNTPSDLTGYGPR